MPSPLAALSAAAGAVLDRSREHFRRKGPGSGTAAIVLVALVAVGMAAGIVGLGVVFDATIEQAVTVDNPDRPSAAMCESAPEDSPFASACDRPERIDVNVGEELRDAAIGNLHYGLLAVPIWWVLFALALHTGAWLAGGSGGLGDSFVVAAWAIVPEVIRLAAGLVAVWYALATNDIGGATLTAIGDEIVVALSAMQIPLLAVSAGVIALQWAIVVGGLEATHDLDRGAAGAVATVFAALAFLLAAA